MERKSASKFNSMNLMVEKDFGGTVQDFYGHKELKANLDIILGNSNLVNGMRS